MGQSTPKEAELKKKFFLKSVYLLTIIFVVIQILVTFIKSDSKSDGKCYYNCYWADGSVHQIMLV